MVSDERAKAVEDAIRQVRDEEVAALEAARRFTFRRKSIELLAKMGREEPLTEEDEAFLIELEAETGRLNRRVRDASE